jgi:multidrug efflux pump subunit AcrB
MKDKSFNYKENIKQRLDEGLKKQTSSITGFLIKNYRFTYLIIFSIIILGGYSLFTMPREANPEVKIPFAMVTTVYPGANPADVEELATDKIEEKVKNLEELKQYSSNSGQGFSSIFVEFNAEADLADSFQKLKEVVDEARPSLPPEAEDPVVTEIRFTDLPIVNYNLVCSEEYGECELKNFADIIRLELEGINGVSKVDIVGGLEREFQVIVNQTKLASFNLSLGQTINAIASANYNLPSGNIEIDGYKYNVRVKGKFQDITALADVVIATYQDSPVFVRDVAEVIDGFKEKQTESKIGFPKQEPQASISITVYKKTGGNIINIVAQADEAIDQLQKNEKIPSDIIITKTDDNSWYIKDSLNTLGLSGLETMTLIIVLLFIVLGLRGALITGFSVPLAFLMAFIFLNYEGETLNSISLYSLVISLGLMVDNSIIITEGINEYITKYNKKPLEAALLSIWNFKWSITAGTMTTVAAFLPMLLVSGILGEFIATIPKTISATLISSLFVALVVIPTLSSRFIKQNNNNKTEEVDFKKAEKKLCKRYGFCARYIGKLKKRYEKLMLYLLSHKRKRRQVLVAAWVLFFIALAAPLTGFMKIQMFPKFDYDIIYVTVELPVGTILEATRQKVAEVEKIIAQIPELKSYTTNLGSLISMEGTSKSGTHLATITTTLRPVHDRKRKSFEIAEEIRPKLKAIQGAEVKVEEVGAGPPAGAPIEVRIFGEDIQDLTDAARQLKKILEEIPGTINVTDSIEDATGEFTFTIDKQQANYYGLNIVTVASTLRSAIYGAKASTVTIDGEDIDITVKYDKREFTNVNDLENLLIFTSAGQNIPLKQITQLSLEPSLLNINHRDSERIITITANNEEGANLQEILTEFENKKNELNLPDDISIDVGGELEDIAQSYRELFLSIFIAIILIAFILVLQFNSFRQPFIIISCLPLAVIGVIVGLNLFRMPFSFPAFMGIVALTGIAVNDAIVLIDRVNKNLAAGMEKVAGLVEAGMARMQPIFLTSLTTIAGVFPLLWAEEIWRGFSVTLIFGLIFSTILTLIIVPILYLGVTHREKHIAQNFD